MIVLLQFLGFGFALTMIYFALLHYRKRTLTSSEMISWTAIWIAFIVIISFPDIFRGFSSSFLFARLFDLLVVVGIFLFSIIASLAYIRSRKTQNKIEDLVRELSIKEKDDKKKIK